LLEEEDAMSEATRETTLVGADPADLRILVEFVERIDRGPYMELSETRRDALFRWEASDVCKRLRKLGI
jgi:hypothetical protein